MARAGRIVADTLALIGEHARPGVTTAELDGLAEEFISGQGGYPTFKGYRGYPAAPASLERDDRPNPRPVQLADGDISVDVGVTLDGFVAIPPTFAIGGHRHRAAPRRGTSRVERQDREQCAVGNRLSGHLPRGAARDRGLGFSVVRPRRALIGRSCTRTAIPNYGQPGRGPLLAEGMTFAIEPMINMGVRHRRA